MFHHWKKACEQRFSQRSRLSCLRIWCAADCTGFLWKRDQPPSTFSVQHGSDKCGGVFYCCSSGKTLPRQVVGLFRTSFQYPWQSLSHWSFGFCYAIRVHHKISPSFCGVHDWNHIRQFKNHPLHYAFPHPSHRSFHHRQASSSLSSSHQRCSG